MQVKVMKRTNSIFELLAAIKCFQPGCYQGVLQSIRWKQPAFQVTTCPVFITRQSAAAFMLFPRVGHRTLRFHHSVARGCADVVHRRSEQWMTGHMGHGTGSDNQCAPELLARFLSLPRGSAMVGVMSHAALAVRSSEFRNIWWCQRLSVAGR
jgi:hypothetical protein